MKKNYRNLFALLTAGMLSSGALLPVQAAADDIHVSVDQKEVSLTQLKSNNYEVPVFIRLEQNVNLNAVEFGINVDTRCRFEIINRSDYAELYGEKLQMSMSKAAIPGMEGYTWLTWGQTSDYYYDKSNILLLMVQIPETVQADDKYEIHYLTQSPSNENKQHVWYNFGTNTDYVKNGSVSWTDGWILVTSDKSDYTRGDVDGNGKIDILDAITVNQAILSKTSLTETQLLAADINGDGKPDSSDSLSIMKYIVGLITEL